MGNNYLNLPHQTLVPFFTHWRTPVNRLCSWPSFEHKHLFNFNLLQPYFRMWSSLFCTIMSLKIFFSVLPKIKILFMLE
uniref:Uncharacterized protein n=1 Tax=Rhizophora mucronata TaxID=61149 RepID=A0A2P2PMM5_RHIMU